MKTCLFTDALWSLGAQEVIKNASIQQMESIQGQLMRHNENQYDLQTENDLN